VIETRFSAEFDEIKMIIRAIRSAEYRTKISLEKTMTGRLLYNPRDLNAAYKAQFAAQSDFAAEMSSGVSYFEQFVWDLKHRGEADIDVPVLIIGVTGDAE